MALPLSVFRFNLTPGVSQRFDIHVAMMGTGFDRSSLIEHLINAHLRRYVVSGRGASVAGTDEMAAG